MSLEGFAINEFEAIKKAACSDIPNLMVVAGPNGVGKSTLLESLYQMIQNGRNIDESAFETNGKATRVVYLPPYRTPTPAPLKKALIEYVSEEGFQESLSRKIFKVQAPSTAYGNQLRGYLQGKIQRSKINPDPLPYFVAKRRLIQIESEWGNSVKEIFKSQGQVRAGEDIGKDIFNPLKESLRKILPGIQFENIEIEGGEYKILFKNRTGDLVEFSDLSSGEKDAMVMTFLLVEEEINDSLQSSENSAETSKEDVLMLIDSPEAYLHPSLQERFFQYLQEYLGNTGEREIQVIMSTHSEKILQNSPSDNLFFLLYPNDSADNQLKQADNLEKELLHAVSRDLGFSALATGRPLLLVEGKIDKEITRRIFPGIEDDIQLVDMGGKEKVRKVDQALNDLLPKLEAEGFEVFAILDKDREWNLNDEVSERTLVLPGTCIENLLLDPQAILEVLEGIADGEEMRNFNSPTDVSELINEIVSSEHFIKEEVRSRIDQKISPVYFDTRELNETNITQSKLEELMDRTLDQRKCRMTPIEDLEQEVTETIDSEQWEELDGKLIVSEIAGKFNLKRRTFKYLLAEEVQPESLPTEYREFMEKVRGSKFVERTSA